VRWRFGDGAGVWAVDGVGGYVLILAGWQVCIIVMFTVVPSFT
jgi:hypothetical protein